MNFFSPKEVANNCITSGTAKAQLPFSRMLVMAILAGAFIACGAIGAAAVAVSIPYASLGKFLGACIFPAGLTMCVLAGSELFTGNCLLSVPLLEKKITIGQLIRNWIVVYFGNFIGGILVAAAVVFSHQLDLFDSGMAISVMSTAVAKVSMPFADALIKGILCNFLVCIAVWITFAAKDVAGKIIGLFFPIMLFVLCGFEHSVANMYYITAGLFAKISPEYSQLAVDSGIDLSKVNVGSMITANLIPVTIGNIIGGAICVGMAYWFIYLKKTKEA